MPVVVKVKKERHTPTFHWEKDSSALGYIGKGRQAQAAGAEAHSPWSSSPSLARARW